MATVIGWLTSPSMPSVQGRLRKARDLAAGSSLSTPNSNSVLSVSRTLEMGAAMPGAQTSPASG
jgi:hypothetical protein